MHRLIPLGVLLVALAGCGSSPGTGTLSPPPPVQSPNIVFQVQTDSNGQTLKEVVLPDGTKCVIVSYSQGIGTTCNWVK